MKDCSERLLNYTTKEKFSLEIDPFIHPLANKREGYNVKIWDVFTDEGLIIHLWKNCHLNESDTTRFDKVYLLRNAQENGSIEELKGRYDYILPSLKLNHIPNVTFSIKGCTQAFKTDILTLDKYTCNQHDYWG